FNMQVKVPINSNILKWAIDRKKIDLDNISKKLKIKVDKVKNWLESKDYPTYSQVEKLSKFLRIPFNYFFFDDPPKIEVNLPDFRKTKEFSPLSDNFYEIYFDIQKKLDWIKEKRINNGFPNIDLIGKFKDLNLNEITLKEIANYVKNYLNLDITKFFNSSVDKYFNYLVDQIENLGVFVLRSGVVFYNNQLKLDIREFRGFAIADPIAPFIFINSNDSLKAQLFTLIHELVHLFFGISNITDADIANNENPIEKIVNQITAEILMPQDIIKKLWNNNQDIPENLQNLSKKLKVSEYSLIYRIYNLNLISQDDFNYLLAKNQKEYLKSLENQINKKNKGGNF
ncbi:MAG: ImmA/IrrE family metallo-endopeptidase, partial [bacterium]